MKRVHLQQLLKYAAVLICKQIKAHAKQRNSKCSYSIRGIGRPAQLGLCLFRIQQNHCRKKTKEGGKRFKITGQLKRQNSSFILFFLSCQYKNVNMKDRKLDQHQQKNRTFTGTYLNIMNFWTTEIKPLNIDDGSSKSGEGNMSFDKCIEAIC